MKYKVKFLFAMAIMTLMISACQGTSQEQESTAEEIETIETQETVVEETEIDKEQLLEQYRKQVDERDPYIYQRIGRNPIYYYKHPSLPIALDFTGEADLARNIFVLATENGFRVGDRAWNYLRNPIQAGLDTPSTSEDLNDLLPIEIMATTHEDKNLIEADEINNPMAARYGMTQFTQIGEQVYKAKSYAAGVNIDEEVMLRSLGMESALSRDIINYLVFDNEELNTQKNVNKGEKVSAQEEWQQITNYLENEPHKFEIGYGMPQFYDYNTKVEGVGMSHSTMSLSQMLGGEKYVDVSYSVGVFDVDDDGLDEYLIRAEGTNQDDVQNRLAGYIAIFKETDDGLRLHFVDNINIQQSRYIAFKNDEIIYFRNQNLGQDDNRLTAKEVALKYSQDDIDNENFIFENTDTFILDLINDFSQIGKYVTDETKIYDTKLEGGQFVEGLSQIEELTDVNTEEIFKEALGFGQEQAQESDQEQAPTGELNTQGFDDVLKETIYNFEGMIGPDLQVYAGIYDLNNDGNPELVIRPVTEMASPAAILKDAWIVYEQSPNGPQLVLSDWFGVKPLAIVNGDTFVTSEYDENIGVSYIRISAKGENIGELSFNENQYTTNAAESNILTPDNWEAGLLEEIKANFGDDAQVTIIDSSNIGDEFFDPNITANDRPVIKLPQPRNLSN